MMRGLTDMFEYVDIDLHCTAMGQLGYRVGVGVCSSVVWLLRM